jgi:hypothetical protein
VARTKALDASLLAKQGYEGSTLWWNLRRLYCYLDQCRDASELGARYRKGLSVSSIAELPHVKKHNHQSSNRVLV